MSSPRVYSFVLINEQSEDQIFTDAVLARAKESLLELVLDAMLDEQPGHLDLYLVSRVVERVEQVEREITPDEAHELDPGA